MYKLITITAILLAFLLSVPVNAATTSNSSKEISNEISPEIYLNVLSAQRGYIQILNIIEQTINARSNGAIHAADA